MLGIFLIFWHCSVLNTVMNPHFHTTPCNFAKCVIFCTLLVFRTRSPLHVTELPECHEYVLRQTQSCECVVDEHQLIHGLTVELVTTPLIQLFILELANLYIC